MGTDDEVSCQYPPPKDIGNRQPPCGIRKKPCGWKGLVFGSNAEAAGPSGSCLGLASSFPVTDLSRSTLNLILGYIASA